MICLKLEAIINGITPNEVFCCVIYIHVSPVYEQISQGFKKAESDSTASIIFLLPAFFLIIPC